MYTVGGSEIRMEEHAGGDVERICVISRGAIRDKERNVRYKATTTTTRSGRVQSSECPRYQVIKSKCHLIKFLLTQKKHSVVLVCVHQPAPAAQNSIPIYYELI